MSSPAGRFRESAALATLPTYPFVALESQVRARRQRSLPILNFGVGDPDLGPPPELVAAARAAFGDAATSRYPASTGESDLRASIARWAAVRFRVRLDPATEVLVLSGSKEGLALLPRALLDPGAAVGVPDPGYPVYRAAAHLARARAHPLPLRAEEGWRPSWRELAPGAQLVYLNYPNNPTGAAVDRAELREAVERAHDGAFALAYDNAYSELTYGEAPAPSILEVSGATDLAVEFHSLSKTFGVPGWRLGFAIGNAEIIAALAKLKSQGDSGTAVPLQVAAGEALRAYAGPTAPDGVAERRTIYGNRLERLASGLRELGIEARMPGGGLYLWHQAPGGSGEAFASTLLELYGIVVTPGSAFGPGGAEYVRWAVTQPVEEIDRALALMASNGDLARSRSPERPGG